MWQSSELIAIAPEQIEISRGSMSEMDTRERTAAAENERRVHSGERIEDSNLKLVESTA